MHSRIFCVGICIFGLLLKIRERFSLLRAENEEAGRTISLHKCQMEKMPAQRAQGGMGLEQAIIDIRNMYKIYNPGENEVRALDGVSLAVYKGGVCGHRRPFRQREIHADEYDRLSGHADVRYIFSQRAGRKRAFR